MKSPLLALSLALWMLGGAIFRRAAEDTPAVSTTKQQAADTEQAWLAELAAAGRRAVQDFKQHYLDQYLKEFEQTTGIDVDISIEWPAIAIAGDEKKYSEKEYWVNVYFVPLKNAIKQIVEERKGKQALKEKLKKVLITFKPEEADSDPKLGVSYDDGVLTIKWRPGSLLPDSQDGGISERTEALVEFLEENLNLE